MENEQNHYKVLGVDKDAGPQEIKHAYRAAARKHHPDSVTGDSNEFRRVQEAYEVLSDEEQRSKYDRNRDTTSHVDMNRSTVYGMGRGERFSGFVREREHRRELSLEVLLSPAEASRGGALPVDVPVSEECWRCGGLGCLACHGSGHVEFPARVNISFPAGVQSGTGARVLLEDLDLPVALHITFIIVGVPMA